MLEEKKANMGPRQEMKKKEGKDCDEVKWRKWLKDRWRVMEDAMKRQRRAKVNEKEEGRE